ncbi:MAG: hypothetical protein HFF26_06210 [Oscillospiraceae bacterium]|nr:hypothetical protein [Oscillospiraceae bacterium]
MKFLDKDGLAYLWLRLKKSLAGKQDRLHGRPGQVVGFNAQGLPEGQDPAAGGGRAGGESSFQRLLSGRWP